MAGLLIWAGLLLTDPESPKPEPQLTAEVARLVKQLDAQELTERDSAERKLLELGERVLPLLPTIGERTPAEIAVRVTRVQQKLLQAQANAASEPKLVTLKGTDLPLDGVLAMISKQTGNPISDYREAFGEEKTSAKVTVDFDKTPFWRALDNVLDQANLTLYGFTGDRGAFVVNRPGDSAPRATNAVYAGVFRLEPVRFEAVRDLRNDSMQSLKFFMEASWEPRLQPFAILQPLSEVRAVGDNGQTIEVSGMAAEPEAMVGEGTSAVELEVPLSLPSRDVKRIRSLKGHLLALVPGALEDFRFHKLPISTRTAPAKRVEQRKAGATVTIDQLRKNNDAWEIAMRVKFDVPSIALESHRSWILDNETYFIDSSGERIEAGGFEQTRQTKDEMGISYFFALKESPDKLDFVYRTPVTVLEVPLEYEFKDIPLP